MIDLSAAQPAIVAACQTRILDYRKWRETPGQSWHYRGKWHSGGTVILFGAEHLRDPSAPQFAGIATAFAAARPTTVWFEGPDRGLASSADQAIREQGEAGYLRFLAAEKGLTAHSFEPSPSQQIPYLRTQFKDDQILLFFALRETARLRDRESIRGANLDEAVSALLVKMTGLAAKMGMVSSVADLSSLDAATRRVWPERDWRTLPSAWFSPGRGESAANFIPLINTAVSDFRNKHLYDLVNGAAARGERVFVVVGRNHVPMLAPALTCAQARLK